MLNINTGDAPKELRAAVLAMKRADSEIRKGVSARMRETMNPEWKSALSQNLTGRPNEARILTAGARITGGNPPQIVTAASKRKFGSGGGLVPDRDWAGFEYGANRNSYSKIDSKGKSYKRRTKRHLPPRGKGRVIEPTVAKLMPRIAAYWVQSVVKSYMDAAEGK